MKAVAHCSSTKKCKRVFKDHASGLHPADRPCILSTLETPQTEESSDNQQTNHEDNLKMNSNIPAEKGVGPSSACGCLHSGKREGIDNRCYCVSLAPGFIRVFKLICQRLPNSHTGLAIRLMWWRKLCVLGI